MMYLSIRQGSHKFFLLFCSYFVAPVKKRNWFRMFVRIQQKNFTRKDINNEKKNGKISGKT